MTLARNAARLLGAVGTLSLAVLFGVALYSYSKGTIVADIYRDQLRELNERYRRLNSQYNEVVRKTAVTELVLKDGQLSVVVRTAEGVLETIPTDLDPSREVHVEYIVKDGRLWIRRVYTLSDPDMAGRAYAKVKNINPRLVTVPWSDDPDLQGLAVFRKDLTEGRWVVTTTGNAALALTKVSDGRAPATRPARRR